jgi:Phage capsid protein
MATSIQSTHVKTFERTVNQLAQQSTNRLRAWCQEVYKNSNGHNWDNLDRKEAVLKAANTRVSTGTAVVGIGTPAEGVFTRRISVPTTWHVMDVVEPDQAAMSLIDPQSALAESHAMAMRRAQDKQIILAANGAPLTGGGAGAVPTGNQVAGAYTTEINFDLVTEVMERFNVSDVDPDEPKCFVIGPKQARKLLQLTEANSADFVTMKPLAERGYVSNWMGFTWILSNLLNVPSATQLDCFAMTKKAMGFHVAKDIWSRAEEDPSNSYDVVVYSASTFGAVRVQDRHHVWVKVADTVT